MVKEDSILTGHVKYEKNSTCTREYTALCHEPVTHFVLKFCFCLVISCFILKLTSLSFQVPCPSSCVKCLIVFPDSQSVSTCSPWLLLCSNTLRLPCLVPVCCNFYVPHSRALKPTVFSSLFNQEPVVEAILLQSIPLFVVFSQS